MGAGALDYCELVCVGAEGDLRVARRGELWRVTPGGLASRVKVERKQGDLYDGYDNMVWRGPAGTRFSFMCMEATGSILGLINCGVTTSGPPSLVRVKLSGEVRATTLALHESLSSICADASGGFIGTCGRAVWHFTPDFEARVVWQAPLAMLHSVCLEPAGGIIVASRRAIYRVALSGSSACVAGSETSSARADGAGSAAGFEHLRAVCLDGAANIIAADGHTIRCVTPGGAVTTLAGRATGLHWLRSNAEDGAGAVATFDRPSGVCVDGTGSIVVVDSWRLRRLTVGAPRGGQAAAAAGGAAAAAAPLAEAQAGCCTVC